MKIKVNLKIASIMMIISLGAMPLFAQQGQGQGGGQGGGQGRQYTEQNVKDRTEQLAKELKCSEVQQKKMMDFELEQYKIAQKEREKMGEDREAMRAYMQEQKKLRDKEYAKFLSSDQMAEYDRIMKERQQQRQKQNQDQQSTGQRGRGGN